MHRTLSIAIAALLFAGHATAEVPGTNGFRIEREDQFAQDYADTVERIDTGVYLVTKGALAGRTITLGEPGLAYDLAALRAQVPTNGRERAVIQARLKRLERTAERFQRQRSTLTTRATRLDIINCAHHNLLNGQIVWYSGSAYVTAVAEYYMSNGSGGLNPYYARANASAHGVLSTPFGVPFGSGTLSAYAVAWNHNTNVISQKFSSGNNAYVNTGYVYSGPDFSHNLEAFSGVEGEGDCFGYVGISAVLK